MTQRSQSVKTKHCKLEALDLHTDEKHGTPGSRVPGLLQSHTAEFYMFFYPNDN